MYDLNKQKQWRSTFAIVTVSTTFKIYISDYLKFKSKNILVGVKSLKDNNFSLNSIQEVI